MSHNRTIGMKGEDAAATYLQARGYIILERNWRYDHKEIDIVARWQDCLVIVEVKTRTGRAFGDPVASITLRKQALLVRAADAYLFVNGLDMDVRFDILVITTGRDRSVIEHIPDAFHPLAGN